MNNILMSIPSLCCLKQRKLLKKKKKQRLDCHAMLKLHKPGMTSPLKPTVKHMTNIYDKHEFSIN